MAVLFPLRLAGSRFFVNPTKIEIVKRSQISEVKTMAGTTFQVWPDLPDEARFEGISFGIRSLQELKNISSAIERNPDAKEVELVYKYRRYTGYVRDLKFSADAENPRIFNYSFGFVIKSSPFQARDMALGQLVGLKAEYDFIEGQLRGASQTIANIPSDQLANVLNAANSISRIGVNIGRVTPPSISSFRP
jgi:hypothetical protein